MRQCQCACLSCLDTKTLNPIPKPRQLPDGSFIVDPEGDENRKGVCRGAALTAVMPSRGEVTLMNHDGEWDVAELQRAVVAGVEAARQTQVVMRSALLESHAQDDA